jgi:hypothetical protein
LGQFDAVVACNDAAVAWPGRLDAAVSLHAEKWPMWLQRRALAGFVGPDKVFASLEAQRSSPPVTAGVTNHTEYRFDGQADTGSSGLFALKVALVDLGCDRAVLCGVPMEPTAHVARGADWLHATKYRKGWEQALPAIRYRARSMSGWTEQLLGRPTPDWIGDHDGSRLQPRAPAPEARPEVPEPAVL